MSEHFADACNMASSPLDPVGPDVEADNKNLLDRLRVSITAKQCCDNICFLLVTCLIISDLVTDIWVMFYFGSLKHTLFMTLTALFLILSSLLTTILFSAQMKTDGEGKLAKMYICLCCNFPFQLGIIYQRCFHGFQKCTRQSVVHAHVRAAEPGTPSNMDWKFAKLKLVQSVLQCAPELIINILHMLIYPSVDPAQIVSASTSFLSLTLGVVLHDKARKDHCRSSTMSLVKVICIYFYKILVLSTRIIAITNSSDEVINIIIKVINNEEVISISEYEIGVGSYITEEI